MEEECPKVKCPAGIPAWVLTFADLMSLLMCFFVLLLSFAEMDVQKFKQIAGSLKVAFGVQRDIKAVEIPKGVNIVAKEFSPSPPQPTIINEVRQKTSQDTNQELMLVKRIDELEATENDLSKKLGKAETEEEREEIQDKIKKVQEEIEQLKEQLGEVKSKIGELQAREIQQQAMEMAASLKQEIEQDIIEIETNQESFLIRIKDKGAFPAGSAQLTDDFIDVLEVIKEELEKIKGGIIVAGHTDDIPINTRAFRSNWDLSAERSVSVVQELLYDSKINPLRISIQAFAESRPLVANDSPANRSKNRRVEIVISKSKSELNSLDDEKFNSKVKKEKQKAKPQTKEKTESKQKELSTQQTSKQKAREAFKTSNRPQPDVQDGSTSTANEDDAFDPEQENFINF
ncbi:MAG: MotB family protein [Pseudomonadota bacterium]